MMNSTISFFRKGFLKRAKQLILLAILIILGSACDKSDNFYLNTAPPENNFNLQTFDTSTLRMYTEKQRPLRTDFLESHLLGAINDPLFGRTTASVFSQLRLRTFKPGFTASTKHDSTVLYLRIYGEAANAFGNVKDAQSWKIYLLKDQLQDNTNYYSDTTIALGDEIGSFNGNLDPKDSVVRIPLSTVLANKLFNATPSDFNENSSFATLIPGIAIMPDSMSASSGKGAIIPFNLISTGATDSRITVYYNDSLTYDLIFGSSSVMLNKYSHDYTGTPVAQQLSKPGTEFSSVFVQSMAGLKAHIEIPYLKNYLDKGYYALNQAQLVFPVADSAAYPFNDKYADKIYFRGRDVNGYDIISDLFPTYQYNYLYRTQDRSYSVIITKDIQNLLNQYPSGLKDYGFNLSIPIDNPVALKQMMLTTPNRAGAPKPKLVLTFTKI